MPNWCENNLTVRGKAKDLKEFLTKFKGKPAKYPMEDYKFFVGRGAERRPMTEEEKLEAIKKDEEEYNNLEPQYCFNALFPVPQEVLDVGFDGHWREWRLREIDANSDEAAELRESLKTLDGYHWQSSHWGTKWDIYHSIISCSGEDLVEEAIRDGELDLEIEVVFDFETAWSPCTEFLDSICGHFPGLEFELKYFEPGVCFAGEFMAADGVTTTTNYDLNSDRGKEFVRENFDEEYGYDNDDDSDEDEE